LVQVQAEGTTTQKGLSIQADLVGAYEKGIQISEEEMSKVQLKPATFHGEWNYTITSQECGGPTTQRAALANLNAPLYFVTAP